MATSDAASSISVTGLCTSTLEEMIANISQFASAPSQFEKPHNCSEPQINHSAEY